MRKTKRMHSLGEDVYDTSKFPLIYPQEFKDRFNDLLEKVTIQNRYANRISQCNMKNMQELAKAREQLQKIATQKKLNELNTSNEKQMVQQMTRKLYHNQDQLQNVFKELIDSKRQIKALKNQISQLQKHNEIEKQLTKVNKMKSIENMISRQINQEEIFTKKINNYLHSSYNKKCFLYRYCQRIQKYKNYGDFFLILERSIEEQIHPEKIYKDNYIQKSRILSQKYPLKRQITSPIKRHIQRHKTEALTKFHSQLSYT